MKLLSVDWAIILFTVLIALYLTVFFCNRAGKRASDFLASSRSVTFWLDGRSIIATTPHIDKPNRVTQRMRQHCVAARSSQELA